MRILIILIAVLSTPAFGEEGPSILKIFDQFVVSSAATSKCAQPDKETLTEFLTNFQTVSVYTSQELQKQFPNRTQQEIAAAMKGKSQAITEKVNFLVAEKGCSDPDVQVIVKRFYMQAKWKPGK